jgi:hypothetical protein
MTQFWFNPSRPSDGLPDLVKLAPPQSEPGVDVPGYLPVEYDECAGIITMPDESTIQWPPPSPPAPNIAQFFTDCVPPFIPLMAWLAVQKPGMDSVINIATSRLDTQSLPMFIALWNTAFVGCDLDPAIATAINIAASNNHVPLIMNMDFTLSIVM